MGDWVFNSFTGMDVSLWCFHAEATDCCLLWFNLGSFESTVNLYKARCMWIYCVYKNKILPLLISARKYKKWLDDTSSSSAISKHLKKPVSPEAVFKFRYGSRTLIRIQCFALLTTKIIHDFSLRENTLEATASVLCPHGNASDWHGSSVLFERASWWAFSEPGAEIIALREEFAASRIEGKKKEGPTEAKVF